MDNIMKWLSTDDKEQNDRYIRALKNVLTPISVDYETKTAVFEGKHGTYNTSIDFCNCVDFSRRKLPCKHIFRLAMEVKLINGDYKSFLHGGYDWKQAIEILEQFSEKVQQEFFKYYTPKNPEPKKKKKTSEMQVLIDNGILIEFPEKETKCYKVVAVIEDFYKETKYFYQYFHRKFDGGDIYYDDNFSLCHMPLPDDKVTKFLNERGFRIGE